MTRDELDGNIKIDMDIVSAIKAITFIEPERAKRIFESLQNAPSCEEPFELLLPALTDVLKNSPEPDMAINNFERWASNITGRSLYYRLLSEHRVLLEILLAVCASSQFFAEILIQNPEIVEILGDQQLRQRPKTAAELHREIATLIAPCHSFLLKLDRLRHFKQREILRIGAMDITNTWELPQVARAISDFADACVQTAYEVCHEELSAKYNMRGNPGIAIIGMGKLGGHELNYSSDIDLIFVCSDNPKIEGDIPEAQYLAKLAEAIVQALSNRMTRGIVFRVDMRLRPEGRFGAMVRSLEGCRQYYESWAETWEFQALIKSRFMAGDALVGETFERLVQPLVYRRFVLDTTIDDVRRNKRRMEKQSQVAGEWETNLKNGYGGIRDIEFTAQLMQLAHGGRLPRVRTGNTLQALDNLRDAGFLPADDAALLAQAYCFLRTVEHRIQILNELQTHHLPTDEAEMNRLARRLGFDGRDPFMAHLNAERGKVREVFERQFYGEHFKKQSDGGGWRDLLQAIEVSKAKSQWIKKLQASGFEEPEKTLQLLRLPLVGSQHGQASPETRRAFLQIAPDLLSLAVRSPSPDAFIGAIDSLAATAPNASQLYVSFHDSPEVMRRLGELAVYAPPLMEQVVRHQELLDLLFSDEIIEQGAKPRELMAEQLVQRLKPAKSHEARLKVIEAFSRRETVRIGARDVWGEAEPVDTAADLYNLSACLVEAIFNTAAQQSELADAAEEMALIGMGKLGGKELNYSSDWDLIFVHSGDSKKANRLVEVFLALCAELKTSGVPSNIDPRLRPEGRFGSLTRPIASFKEYYETQAEVWEKQALIKTSFVAGNQILGKEMLGLVNEVTYAHSLTKEETAEIRHMKSRLENERLNPDERETDIKLGRGGLTDIEFTVQLLQMRCGFEKPDVRQPNTLQALHALLTSAHIERPDFLVLYNAYRYLYSLRNRMYLLSGLPTDLLPTEGRRLTILARGLGTHDTNRFLHNHHTRLDEVSQVVKRLFWG